MTTHMANLKHIAKKNQSFRKVLATGGTMQVIVMALAAGEDVGEEVHVGDQLFVGVAGSGEIVVDGLVQPFEKDHAVLVSSGSRHDVRASRHDELKFYSVSTVSRYPRDTDHSTKRSAMVAEAESEAVVRVPSAL